MAVSNASVGASPNTVARINRSSPVERPRPPGRHGNRKREDHPLPIQELEGWDHAENHDGERHGRRDDESVAQGNHRVHSCGGLITVNVSVIARVLDGGK